MNDYINLLVISASFAYSAYIFWKLDLKISATFLAFVAGCLFVGFCVMVLK